MKFKCAVLGLLVAILATCIFTSYTLITEAKIQKEIALAHLTMNIEMNMKMLPSNEDLTDSYWKQTIRDARNTYEKYTYQR